MKDLITISSLDGGNGIENAKPISVYSIVFDTPKLKKLIEWRGLEEVVNNAKKDIESNIRMIYDS